MRHSAILFLLLSCLVLTGCSVRDLSYFQDARGYGQGEALVAEQQQRLLRLQPEDKISIVVNSRNPELARMFNLAVETSRIGQIAGGSSQANQMGCYTLDAEGCVSFPQLGRVSLLGLTRAEAAAVIQKALSTKNLLQDATVTVEFQNLSFSVMGEVARPGRYVIDKDHLTLLTALAQAGDLTVSGVREDVLVIRQEGGAQRTYHVDLTQMRQLMSSPVYYLQQDDVVYVQPNKKRSREATVNGNNVLSTSFWVSVASLVTSIVTSVFVIVRD